MHGYEELEDTMVNDTVAVIGGFETRPATSPLNIPNITWTVVKTNKEVALLANPVYGTRFAREEWLDCICKAQAVEPTRTKKVKSESKPRGQMTEENVRFIRAQHAADAKQNSYAALARQFHVSPALIRNIVLGNVYKDII